MTPVVLAWSFWPVVYKYSFTFLVAGFAAGVEGEDIPAAKFIQGNLSGVLLVCCMSCVRYGQSPDVDSHGAKYCAD